MSLVLLLTGTYEWLRYVQLWQKGNTYSHDLFVTFYKGYKNGAKSFTKLWIEMINKCCDIYDKKKLGSWSYSTAKTVVNKLICWGETNKQTHWHAGL